MSPSSPSPDGRRLKGRPRSFSEDAVVNTALHVFWQKGFEKTAIDEVIQVAGVSKSSFYGAFDSKETLLLRVLERYRRTWMDGIMLPLAETTAVVAAVCHGPAVLMKARTSGEPLVQGRRVTGLYKR